MANTVSDPSLVSSPASRDIHPRASFTTLTIGSIGVVYGDIGTSPLYAFREALNAASGSSGVTQANVLGVLSLIIWALILIVTLKYVVILLRADNKGEGGILSLMALAQSAGGRMTGGVALLGMIGAALFYGDAIITPAISVLSAVEGLKLVAPAFEAWIVPLTLLILFVLFGVQYKGTAAVARLFGPVTLIWFVAIGALGVVQVVKNPGILAAFNPAYAVWFISHDITIGLVTLGAVFLAVTGAEALYADLGHFGRKPIQTAWIVAVFPALVLNYLGQGALVLERPETISNPFYLMAPDWFLLPLVLLATAATIIASQAVITGAYSLTQQAVQLGLLPRMEIRHTSDAQSGQIYVPRVNRWLLIGVLALVVLFRASDKLASAYGIAVTGTMVVTAILAFLVIWKVWGWRVWAAALVMIPFIGIDLVFLAANALKVIDGGYVPILTGCAILLLMVTWRRGTRLLAAKTRKSELPLGDLVGMLDKKPPNRAPGTAVFLTSNPELAPTALMHNLKHNAVLHQKNIILSVRTADAPYVAEADRVAFEDLGSNFARAILTFGYMETPDIPKALLLCRPFGWKFEIMSTSFFLSRRALKPALASRMPRWQDDVFIAMSSGATNATDFFRIPTGRVVDLGVQVSI